MPSRAEMERVASIGIAEQIEKHGPPMVHRLASLQLLEAAAMICFLADATLARLPPDERMGLAEAIIKTILEDAQDSVDAERPNGRD